MEYDAIDRLGDLLPRRRTRAITRELRTHIDELSVELEQAGWSREDAITESLARLGDPQEIADAFADVHRPGRKTQLGMAVALATGMLLGVYGVGGSLASAFPQHRVGTHVHTPPRPALHHRSAPVTSRPTR